GPELAFKVLRWRLMVFTENAGISNHFSPPAGVHQLRIARTRAFANLVVFTILLCISANISFGQLPISAGNGLRAVYYATADLTGRSLTRVDPTVNFNWKDGSPDPSIWCNCFSARWTGQLQALYSETYTFYTMSDDGIRVWIDGQQVISNWTSHAATVNQGSIRLDAGKRYDIKIEYFESYGGAIAKLEWQSPSQPRQVIPQAQLSPIAANLQAVNDIATTNASSSVDINALANDISSNRGVIAIQ